MFLNAENIDFEKMLLLTVGIVIFVVVIINEA